MSSMLPRSVGAKPFLRGNSDADCAAMPRDGDLHSRSQDRLGRHDLAIFDLDPPEEVRFRTRLRRHDERLRALLGRSRHERLRVHGCRRARRLPRWKLIVVVNADDLVLRDHLIAFKS